MSSRSSNAPARFTSNGPKNSAAWTTKSLTRAVANSGEALKALARLREALQTLPFFGSGKVVWLQNCNFLGDERAASAQAVTAALAELAQELKAFLLAKRPACSISAGKVDKRKVFFKTLDKIGTVESFAGWSVDDRDWADQAEGVGAQGASRPAKGDFRGGAGGTDQPRRPQRAPARQRNRKALALRRRPAGQSSWRTSPRFARGTKRRGRSPWATRWATAICRACCAGWTRNCGKSSSIPGNPKSVCSTA